MQTIKVNFLSHLAKFVGTRVATLDFNETPTVARLLARLQSTYGANFTENFMKNGELAHEMITLLINGLNLKQCAMDGQDPHDVVLKESDDITFIVQFGGG